MQDKAALIRCESYDHQEVDRAVAQAFALVGGLGQWIKPGMTVAIKANLLMKKKPEAFTTTHPAVIEAVAKQVRALGATAVIGDSPGGPFTPALVHGVYRTCGMEQAAENAGAVLNEDFEQVTVYEEKSVVLRQMQICRYLTQADAVIDCAKLKTHGLTQYTGAVKNLYGCVPGTVKVEYHFRMPALKDFSQMLVDLCEHIRPVVSLIDAVEAMEGDGPSGGTMRKMNCLIASSSAYAADVVGTRLMGLKPESICTVQRAIERRLVDPEQVLVLGERIEDYIANDYQVPVIQGEKTLPRMAPTCVMELLEKWMKPKPVFLHKKCVGCGDCFRSCPPKAISMKEGKPQADLDVCIRCFCCQELCPVQAIRIKRNKLLKWIG